MRSWPALLLLLSACGSATSTNPDGATAGTPDARAGGQLDPALVGAWPDTSALIFPDDGSQGQDLTGALGQILTLAADGSFSFAGGTGTWTVGVIAAADWTRWSYGPYDNQRKLVLMTSAGALRDGPISDFPLGGVASFDIYYHTTTPLAGEVRLSFMQSKR